MAIQLNFANMLQLTSILSPTLITFFLVMLSLFNLNMKGIFYLAGAFLATIVNYMLGPLFTNDTNITLPPMCNLIEIPMYTQYTNPSVSTMYLSFTLMYLFLPMFYYNQINLYLVTALILMIGIDIITKVQNDCTDMLGSFVGMLLGIILSIIWFMIIVTNKLENLLYYEEFGSNKPFCKKNNTRFKCSYIGSGNVGTGSAGVSSTQ